MIILKKNSVSVKAIKTVVETVKARVKIHDQSEEVKIQYALLRATSGGFILDTIRDRMSNAFSSISIIHLNLISKFSCTT